MSHTFSLFIDNKIYNGGGGQAVEDKPVCFVTLSNTFFSIVVNFKFEIYLFF